MGGIPVARGTNCGDTKDGPPGPSKVAVPGPAGGTSMAAARGPGGPSVV